MTDGSNEVVVTCGLVDGVCRVWSFRDMKQIGDIVCGSAIVCAKVRVARFPNPGTPPVLPPTPVTVPTDGR